MNFLWTLLKELFFYLQPFFFWLNVVLYGIIIFLLFASVVILLLYTYARIWRWNDENCTLLFQVWDTFKLWRLYLRNPEDTKIPYKVRWFIQILTRIQNKKYRSRQRRWWRNTWAKVFKEIRRQHFESKKEK